MDEYDPCYACDGHRTSCIAYKTQPPSNKCVHYYRQNHEVLSIIKNGNLENKVEKEKKDIGD